jgi:hypothetical protein
MNKLMECAFSQNDDRLVRVLNCDDFVLKRVYHNGYITNRILIFLVMKSPSRI